MSIKSPKIVFSGLSAKRDELGRRIARARLNMNVTQQALATEAGITRKTLSNLENGANCDVSSLLRVLDVLNLADSLVAALPAAEPSPLALAKSRGKRRQRAGRPRGAARVKGTNPGISVQWGEDE